MALVVGMNNPTYWQLRATEMIQESLNGNAEPVQKIAALRQAIGLLGVTLATYEASQSKEEQRPGS